MGERRTNEEQCRLDQSINKLGDRGQEVYYQLLAEKRNELAKKNRGRPPQVSIEERMELVDKVRRQINADSLGLHVNVDTMEESFSRYGQPIGGAQPEHD